MITELKKLTGNHKELDKTQCRKIKGLGISCGKKCDETCGIKFGSDADHYASQRSLIEDPIE